MACEGTVAVATFGVDHTGGLRRRQCQRARRGRNRWRAGMWTLAAPCCKWRRRVGL